MSVLEQRLPWNFIPADGIGYVNSEDFLTWPDGVVLHFIRTFETHRYQSWRNFNNLWRSTLGLDSTHGKRVKDFGCGFGIEALQFAKSGNEVLLSDIFPSNVQAAERVLRLSGYTPAPDGPVDVFYSNGVLHHSPQMRELLEKEVANLNPGGEVRLLLYSDRAWILTTATRVPPIEDDVSTHPAFRQFVAQMDDVGEYADWYSREKLEYRVKDLLTVKEFNYITLDGRYATAILEPV